MFIFFLSIHLARLGADPVAIGSILGGMGIMMMISHIPAGHLSDRIGRRPLLLAGWSLGVVAVTLMALAAGLPLFVAGLFLYGFTNFVMSPLNSYVSSARGNWTVGRALAVPSAFFGFGSAIGPLTGGWLGDLYGLRPVFALAAIVLLISTIVLSFIRPQPRDHHDPASPTPGLLRNRRYLGFLAVVFAVMFALNLSQPLTPNFLHETRSLDLSKIGLLGTVGVLGNALLTMAFGAWFVPRTSILLGQLFTAMFALLIWRTVGIPFYALAYFLLGGFRATNLMLSAGVRELVHPPQMGIAFGLKETFTSLALTLSNLSAGILYKQSPALMYPTALGLIAFSILLTLWLVPRPGGEHA